MNNSEILVVRGPTLRNDIITVVGVMPAETLVRHRAVPVRSTLKNSGYQRNVTLSRVTQLAGEIRSRNVDLPTSVLLNLRNVREDEVLSRHADGTDNYTLSLDPELAHSRHQLFVVDGQHRIAALEKAMEQYEVDLRNFKLPFVCMIGASEDREMEQFHVVNSNAKSVPTDLAYDLLKARAETDLRYREYLEHRGKKWQIDAQALTERLSTASSTWKGRIRLPNSPKGETTVGSTAFVRSLKILLTQTVLFSGLGDVARQAQVIDTYWRAVRRVFPTAFEEPERYNIQRGIGVEVLHRVLPIVLDLARTEGGSLFSPDTYVPIIRDALCNLDGLNGDGQTVMGEEFWLTGRDGASAAFSSVTGQQRLAERLRVDLPKLDIH